MSGLGEVWVSMYNLKQGSFSRCDSVKSKLKLGTINVTLYVVWRKDSVTDKVQVIKERAGNLGDVGRKPWVCMQHGPWVNVKSKELLRFGGHVDYEN